jgi:hypothetical protein
MTRLSIVRTIAVALVLAVGTLASVAAGESQNKGRYKKQGDKCVWDANDGGPNQCTPQTTGHFKKEGDGCVWDAQSSGDDQCRPATGRFKKEGSRCEWNAKDSGPDQCNPRQPK